MEARAIGPTQNSSKMNPYLPSFVQSYRTISGVDMTEGICMSPVRFLDVVF